ncbi:uncharacterized protein IL334_006621 [Kwoniella shivajii]|uniref:SUN domain-containing protein n=1 Tax=Kwoniella shivajii TaxID=564305 RepID=A0ABZ1D7P5_9TREE|nr:hypothetical protein IL334_006621 [Kwoniella shivajii]
MASTFKRAPPPPPLLSLNGSNNNNNNHNNNNSVNSINGFSRSPPSTSISIVRRPHSDPVSSKNSSVHFNLEDQDQTLIGSGLSPSSPSSKSSMRPSQEQNGHNNNTNKSYQPIHPSTLHNSTIPSPPKLAPLLTTGSSYTSINNPSSNPTSLTSSPTSLRPEMPRNRSSQDRRVWSETLPSTSRHRSESLLANGKKASRVTGGFETSSEEDMSDDSNKEGDIVTPSLSESLEPSSQNAIAGPSRPRAKSLLLAAGRERQSSDASGTSRDNRRRKEDPSRPKKRKSKEPGPPSRMLSYRSNVSPPKSSSIMTTSKSDSYFNLQNGSSPKSRLTTNKSSPLIESTVPGPSKNSLTRGSSLNMLEERGSEGEASHRPKGKEKEVNKQPDNLAASLGLGIGGIQDMALSPEQLRDLLSDSDVSSALRLLNSPHMPASRPTNMNEWSNSVFFSPPASRPGSPDMTIPKHTSPYLVSAPPALTSSENHARERTMSVASSIHPPVHSTWGSTPRHRQSLESHGSPDLEALRRRRASSKGGLTPDGQGGHVPFTHHLPVPHVEEGAPEEEEDLEAASDGLPAITENDLEPTRVPTQSSKSSKEVKENKDKKNRLSSLFSMKKKKSIDQVSQQHHEHHLLHRDHKSDRQKEEEKAREKEKYEKDVERRRLEQERRDEELAQERRFRALTQVAAHPKAERRAYQTGAHLRALYQHVYDGIESPPKLNPLAIVRWKIKTEEQNEARSRWEQEQSLGDVKSDKSNITNLASPQTQTRTNHLGGNIQSSPMSIGSSTKYGFRQSAETHRPASLGSLGRANDSSPRKGKVSHYEKGWSYTVEDFAAYQATKGQVNYFIAPRKSHPDVEVLTEDERPPDNSQVSRSNKDDNSSIADSNKKSHLHTMGVKTASNTSLLEVEGVLGENNALSRSTSIETGRGSNLPRHRHLTHRTHQSLSAVGPTAISHALKQPFEKISHAAKKQRNPPPAACDEGESQHIERFRNHTRSDTAPAHMTNMLHQTPMSNKPSRTTMNSSASRTREPGFFKRHAPTPGAESYTDEETTREFHLRRLFLKGQKVFSSSLDDSSKLYRRSDASLVKDRQDERETELLALEAALIREKAFRERQAAVSRKTQLEIEARDRINKLEKEIYAERVEHLAAARRKLEVVTSNIMTVDDTMRQYLYQIDFVRDEASISAEIDIDWSSVDPLRATYGDLGRVKQNEDDEHRDTLPPLKSFGSNESGSDIPRRPRNNPTVSRKARTQSMSSSVPRRKGSLNASLAPISLSHLTGSMRHRPRRTYLDPTGSNRVDPIKQAEMVISFGKERLEDMGKEKENTRIELNHMIYEIESMIKQKELVRKFLREFLEKNQSKQYQLDQLNLQLKNSTLATLQFYQIGEVRDRLINSVAQTIGAFLRIFFWFIYQAKGELNQIWSFIKPTSMKCTTHNSNTRGGGRGMRSKDHIAYDKDHDHDQTNGNGSANGHGNDADTISPRERLSRSGSNEDEKRLPFLGTSILIIAVGLGFYLYGG